jgi:hypothetical protein
VKEGDEYAFPNSSVQGDFITGMTLRDYFAGKALAGFCSLQDSEGLWQWDADGVSVSAYEVADAMLKQRFKE